MPSHPSGPAVLPLHPLGPPLLLVPSQSPRARTTMDRLTVMAGATTPISPPPRAGRPAGHCQLLPSTSLPYTEKNWSGDTCTSTLVAPLLRMKLVAAPAVQPFSFHL